MLALPCAVARSVNVTGRPKSVTIVCGAINENRAGGFAASPEVVQITAASNSRDRAAEEGAAPPSSLPLHVPPSDQPVNCGFAPLRTAAATLSFLGFVGGTAGGTNGPRALSEA